MSVIFLPLLTAERSLVLKGQVSSIEGTLTMYVFLSSLWGIRHDVRRHRSPGDSE